MTRTGTLVGTPAYMAPEQMARGTADARSDVFSFCVSLYEALYGERPFEGSTLEELGQAVVHEAIPAPPSRVVVPEWLRRIVVLGLRVDPARRPQSMQALLGAIASGLAGEARE
jgi:serine/threonine-protein kinase